MRAVLQAALVASFIGLTAGGASATTLSIAFEGGQSKTILSPFNSLTGQRTGSSAFLDDSSGDLPIGSFGGMAFAPNGDLYVAFEAGPSKTILSAFNPLTGQRIGSGAYLDDSSGDLPLGSLAGMAFAPSGELYIAFEGGQSHTLLSAFNPLTGQRIGLGATLDDSTGHLQLNSFAGMAFAPSGELYIAFEGGQSHTLLSTFNPLTGKRTGLGATLDDSTGHLQLDGFGGMAFAPNGDLYIAFEGGQSHTLLSAFNPLTGKRIGLGATLDDSTGHLQLGSFGGMAIAPATPTAAVPEPAAWALMVIGFGGLGVSLRRARRLGRVILQV